MWDRQTAEQQKCQSLVIMRHQGAGTVIWTGSMSAGMRYTTSVVAGTSRKTKGKETIGGVGSEKATESSGKELELSLRKDPAVVHDLGGPYPPKHLAELRRWRSCDYDHMFWESDNGMCGAAELVQAFDSVCKRIVAEAYYWDLCGMRPTLDSLSRMVEALK